jgi:hypothetical protein
MRPNRCFRLGTVARSSPNTQRRVPTAIPDMENRLLLAFLLAAQHPVTRVQQPARTLCPTFQKPLPRVLLEAMRLCYLPSGLGVRLAAASIKSMSKPSRVRREWSITRTVGSGSHGLIRRCLLQTKPSSILRSIVRHELVWPTYAYVCTLLYT